MYDFAVVGGGPAGSHAAAVLAAKGHSVLVLEERAGPGEKGSCTGIVSAECLQHFPQLHAAAIREFQSARVYSPSGQELRVHRSTPQAYLLDRALADAVLAQEACRAGAEYVYRAKVESIIPGDDCMRLGVDGLRAHEVEAQAVVLACGFSPRLTAALGFGRIQDWALGAQARVEMSDVPEVELYLGRDVAPGFFAWVVPSGPGAGLVGLFSRDLPSVHLEALLKSLRERGVVRRTRQISHGVIPLRPLRHTYGHRLLALGDAAGQVKPTSGGGIYFGLIASKLAAETLHEAALLGDFSQRVLRRYEQRWKRRLLRELRIGYAARKVFETFDDSEMEEIFRVVSSNGIHHDLLHSQEFGFDWHARLILKAARHHMLGTLLKRGTAALFAQEAANQPPG